jgi:phage tail protein X
MILAITHRVREGERWDTLAWRYYRDVREMSRLIAANPHAPRSGILPAGLRIAVPLITRPAVTANGLPPWRR